MGFVRNWHQFNILWRFLPLFRLKNHIFIWLTRVFFVFIFVADFNFEKKQYKRFNNCVNFVRQYIEKRMMQTVNALFQAFFPTVAAMPAEAVRALYTRIKPPPRWKQSDWRALYCLWAPLFALSATGRRQARVLSVYQTIRFIAKWWWYKYWRFKKQWTIDNGQWRINN